MSQAQLRYEEANQVMSVCDFYSSIDFTYLNTMPYGDVVRQLNADMRTNCPAFPYRSDLEVCVFESDPQSRSRCFDIESVIAARTPPVRRSRTPPRL